MLESFVTVDVIYAGSGLVRIAQYVGQGVIDRNQVGGDDKVCGGERGLGAFVKAVVRLLAVLLPDYKSLGIYRYNAAWRWQHLCRVSQDNLMQRWVQIAGHTLLYQTSRDTNRKFHHYRSKI